MTTKIEDMLAPKLHDDLIHGCYSYARFAGKSTLKVIKGEQIQEELLTDKKIESERIVEKGITMI